jgi:hypothetical protein
MKHKKLFPIREPNGRLSRTDDIASHAPTAIKRLRDAALRGMADAEWGTELGRLFLEGRITAEHYAAGKKWGRTVVAYHQAIGAAPPYPKAVAFGDARGRSPDPDPASHEGKRLTARDKAIIQNMQEAHAVLIGAGILAERAVRSVCESNECPVGQVGLDALQRGLYWLGDFWGLTKKPRHVRIPA